MEQIKIKFLNLWRKFTEITSRKEDKAEINGHRNLMIFIASSLGIAIVLAGASLWLYSSDGTIQLDLSRPALQDAREAQKKAKEQNDKQGKGRDDFPAQGGLNEKDIGDFQKIYSNTAKDIHSNEFDENLLNDEALNIIDQ